MALICLMKRLRLKHHEIVEVVDSMPKLQKKDKFKVPIL